MTGILVGLRAQIAPLAFKIPLNVCCFTYSLYHMINYYSQTLHKENALLLHLSKATVTFKNTPVLPFQSHSNLQKYTTVLPFQSHCNLQKYTTVLPFQSHCNHQKHHSFTSPKPL